MCLKLDKKSRYLIESIDIERERISLNRKKLLPDPWEIFSAKHGVGDLMTGSRNQCVWIMAFLLLLSAGWKDLVPYQQDAVTQSCLTQVICSKPGDEVLIRILDIDVDRKRIQMDIDSVSYDEQLGMDAGTKRSRTRDIRPNLESEQ